MVQTLAALPLAIHIPGCLRWCALCLLGIRRSRREATWQANELTACLQGGNELAISEGITSIFKSSEVKALHTDRLGRDPLQVMRDLSANINEEGRLTNPSDWNIPGGPETGS